MDVIDTFLATFIAYIDSGFGLLAGDVAYLTTTLIAIDITLAGLFWALSQNSDVIAGLIKKVLYVGFFAFVIGNFSLLANIVFDSFAQLGVTAGGGTMTAADLLRPGFIAGVGFDAAQPLLAEISDMLGPISFFHNFIMITVMFIAWAIIMVAFFVLAVQLFITILEFKLTTLAGFVLVPFALWNKTSFLAERVLGNVVSSGIKVMVLAIIIGIGSTLFTEVTSGLTGDVSLEDAGGVILASLALFALGLFGPGIATGLVTGAPQLDAGAAVGTVAAVGAASAAGAAGAIGTSKAAGSAAMGATKAGASLGGGASMAFAMGKAASGAGGVKGAAAGLSAVAQAGAGTVANATKGQVSKAGGALKASSTKGARGAITGTGGSMGPAKGGAASAAADAASGGSADQAPDWAKKAKPSSNSHRAESAALHALRGGDSGGASSGPKLKDDE